MEAVIAHLDECSKSLQTMLGHLEHATLELKKVARPPRLHLVDAAPAPVPVPARDASPVRKPRAPKKPFEELSYQKTCLGMGFAVRNAAAKDGFDLAIVGKNKKGALLPMVGMARWCLRVDRSHRASPSCVRARADGQCGA